MTEPEVLRNLLFGLLERDPEGDWGGEIVLEGRKVALFVVGPPNAAMQHALEAWKERAVALKRQVCETLLERAQREFAVRNPREAPLTLEHFTFLLYPTGLTLEQGGSSMGFYTDDDRIFGPHKVVTELDAQLNLTDACIYG